MCCLFTCCGWMIDLIQRLWTFTMSCCISSAVCCALVTASMAGIALGYNYSLAEYIDLKETNVSVYLKRGVFDDEIGDDMDWRRSGHLPVAGHIGENNLMTGAPEEDSSSIRSGRRLDDSIYESDDRNKFEGSLMKLTAKPPAPSSSPERDTTVDADKILSKYSMGSLDQMKALQSLINMRKFADPRLKIGKEKTKTSEYIIDDRYQPHMPVNPDELKPGRRFMPLPPVPGVQSTPGESARFAVPQEPLNEPAKWKLPKLPSETFTRDQYGDYDVRPTYPMPVTPRAGPVRPTRPKPTARPRPTMTSVSTPLEPQYPKSIDVDSFRDKLFDSPGFKEDNFMKKMKGQNQDDDDYADAIKGVPLRKKRHSIVSDLSKNETANKSSINDSSIESSKNLEFTKSNNLMHRLQKSLYDVRYKANEREISSFNNKLKGLKDYADSTISSIASGILSSDNDLKLLITLT